MNDLQNDFISGIGNTPLIKLRAASEITGCNICLLYTSDAADD